MTGLRPSSTGVYGMIADNELKDANERTRSTEFLHQYFKNSGYYMMGVGKIFHHHVPDGILDESGGASSYGPSLPKRKNWDQKGTATDWAPFPERDDQMPDDAAVKWTVDRLKRSYDKPFFLTVGFIRPHVPWYVPKKWFDLYDPAKLHLPPFLKNDLADLPPISEKVNGFSPMPTTEWAIENDQWRNIIQAYLACVSYTDHNVGTVLSALKESKHAGNTIVVLWSDHGYRLGEKNTFAKQCLWDRATKAPLIFSGPGIPKNVKIAQPVELLSLYPTLTDLCGLPPNKLNEGVSLEPFFRNPKMKWGHHALTTWGRNNHAIKTKAYRYIHYEDGSEELYALKTDPNEWHNLAGDQKYVKVMQELKKLLPAVNEKWAKASAYDATDYLKNQKAEQGVK
jgi:arylsulfatase A-like enzyme